MAAVRELKFPSHNSDRPLIVHAFFKTKKPAILSLVKDYLNAWIRANGIWTRIWRSNVITEERLDFDADFLTKPRLDVGSEEGSFAIVFEVRPHASRWKDWAVFLVSDITKIFHEIKLQRFEMNRPAAAPKPRPRQTKKRKKENDSKP